MDSKDTSPTMPPMTPLRYKVVLFDLDDTLFDHQAHRREALAAVKAAAGFASSVEIASLEASHERHLQRTYLALMGGQCSQAQARAERMRGLLADHGITPDEQMLDELERVYRAAYDRHWRPVPGAVALLNWLRDAGAWLGLITNGRVADQRPKIERLGLAPLFDGIFISESVGAQKPSGLFFAHVARQAGALPQECLVVGDLWETDIVGARQSGMGALWLNRYGRPAGEDGDVPQVSSFEPLDAMAPYFAP
jgi:HAD superfamily hydrolase (TIGR01509 family)